MFGECPTFEEGRGPPTTQLQRKLWQIEQSTWPWAGQTADTTWDFECGAVGTKQQGWRRTHYGGSDESGDAQFPDKAWAPMPAGQDQPSALGLWQRCHHRTGLWYWLCFQEPSSTSFCLFPKAGSPASPAALSAMLVPFNKSIFCLSHPGPGPEACHPSGLTDAPGLRGCGWALLHHSTILSAMFASSLFWSLKVNGPTCYLH